MIDLAGLEQSPEALSKKLLFPLSPSQVKKSLDFLLKNGFIKRSTNDQLHKIEKTLATGDIKSNPVLGVIVRDFHKKFSEIGLQSIDKVSSEYRKTTNTTLSLSKKSYELALERINALRFELLEIAKSEKNPDDVYQLHINMFPLTKINPPQV